MVILARSQGKHLQKGPTPYHDGTQPEGAGGGLLVVICTGDIKILS